MGEDTGEVGDVAAAESRLDPVGFGVHESEVGAKTLSDVASVR